MRVGLSVYDIGAPELVDLAEAADGLGFDAVWLGEHILHPAGYTSAHPTHGTAAHAHHAGPIVDPSTELIDPLVALGAAATRTTRIGLATGIHLLPLRHPLLTARAAATLQDLSGGRFMLGIGAGWLREEFDALGVPFSGRGRRVDESVTVMRAAWRGESFEHIGEVFRLGPMQVTSRPTAVPIVCGGNSDVALERAAAIGDAWFGSGTPSIDEAHALITRLQSMRRAASRGEPFRCYVRVDRPDAALIEAYATRGLHDVVVWADQVWRGEDLEAKRESLRQCATGLGLVV
jgi:probable F420-dependent oxidoreductase